MSPTKTPLIERDLLYDLYITQEKTSIEIAKDLGFCQRTILNYLHKYNIPVRNKIKLDKGELRKHYLDLNLTVDEIAEKFGVSRWTIQRRAKEFGFEMRETLFQKGEKNPKWKEEELSYKGIHKWLRENYEQPEKCERCGKKKSKLDIASKDGNHKRDINNYEWLCRSCHVKKDGVIEIINEKRLKKRQKNKKGEDMRNIDLYNDKALEEEAS